MSSFKGRMRLYPNICIDRFDGVNLRCSAFFLSHCHKDHMAGLDDSSFLHTLKSRKDVFLYCTEITRLLLLADEEYKALEEFIKILDVGQQHSIHIPADHLEKDGCDVEVTAVSAGHCPGSAMFLFEGSLGTCLYTGDFRWEENYAASVSAFKVPGDCDRLKTIDHLHVDTTFCVPTALHIPSRMECAEVTVSVVAMWLRRSPKHQVAFFCPARYGYEFLMREIATRLGEKIHVSTTKLQLYEQIPDLAGLCTSNPTEARVHACRPKMRKNPSAFPPCSRSDSSDIDQETYHMLNIRPCAMWFTTKTGRAGLEKLTHIPASPRGLQRVCYSMHSSFSEIKDLVSYLQPKHVWPNVIPASDDTPEKVQNFLKTFLEMPHPLRPAQCASSRQRGEPEIGSLEVVNNKPSLFTFQPHESDSSEGCVFSSQESPKAGKERLVKENAVAGYGNVEKEENQTCELIHSEDRCSASNLNHHHQPQQFSTSKNVERLDSICKLDNGDETCGEDICLSDQNHCSNISSTNASLGLRFKNEPASQSQTSPNRSQLDLKVSGCLNGKVTSVLDDSDTLEYQHIDTWKDPSEDNNLNSICKKENLGKLDDTQRHNCFTSKDPQIYDKSNSVSGEQSMTFYPTRLCNEEHVRKKALDGYISEEEEEEDDSEIIGCSPIKSTQGTNSFFKGKRHFCSANEAMGSKILTDSDSCTHSVNESRYSSCNNSESATLSNKVSRSLSAVINGSNSCNAYGDKDTDSKAKRIKLSKGNENENKFKEENTFECSSNDYNKCEKEEESFPRSKNNKCNKEEEIIPNKNNKRDKKEETFYSGKNIKCNKEKDTRQAVILLSDSEDDEDSEKLFKKSHAHVKEKKKEHNKDEVVDLTQDK